jgi:dephospho-CoA kinase
MTFVLGLTGSIGMGKSATAAMLRRNGVPVHDADESVHALYGGEAAHLIEAAFPGTVTGGAVDRARLSAILVAHPERLRTLEAIVHPLVRREEERFLSGAVARAIPLVVLDVPLLFETGGERRCDAVMLVTTEAAVQRHRVFARPGMSEEKFALMLSKQMPDAEKRRRAHFRVDTGHGFAAAERQVCDTLRALAGRPGAVGRAVARRI